MKARTVLLLLALATGAVGAADQSFRVRTVSLPEPPPEPPAGEPDLRDGHPRILVIEATDTGIGVPLDDLRTRLCTADYATNFQTYMTRLDARSLSPTGKAKAPTIYEGYGFALAALLHDGSMSCITWGFSRATYTLAAKDHALAIAAKMYPTLDWGESGDLESLAQHNSPSMGIALMYDWAVAAGGSFTNTEKQTLMNGCTKNYDARSDDPIFGSRYQGPFRSVCTLAMRGEGPTGTYPGPGASNGKAYTTLLDEMYDQVWSDWLDADGLDANGYHDEGIELHINEAMSTSTGGEGPGDIPGSSYMISYFIQNVLFAFLSATASNFDLFTRNDYFGQLGHWMMQAIRPEAWVNTGVNGIVMKYAVSGQSVGFGSSFHPWAFHVAWGAAGLKATPDTTLIAMLRWTASNFGISHDQPGVEGEMAAWPLLRFILGNEHVPAQSPTAAGLAQSYEAGNGWIFLNSCYTSEACTKVTLHWPQTPVFSGHWKPFNGMGFSLQHRGMLVNFYGQSKGDGGASIGFQAYAPNLNTVNVSVYDSSEVTEPGDATTQKDNGRYGGYSFNPTGTGICNASVDRYLCDAGSLLRVALNAASNTYDYIWGQYTGYWRPSKVSYADREFEYIRGAQDEEYAAIVDRLQVASDTFPVRFTMMLGQNATSSAALTPVETASAFDRVQGGIWTTPGTATIRSTNEKTLEGVVGNGAVLIKGLYPAGTWTILGGDFYEFRDATSARHHYQLARPDITTVTTGSSPATVTTDDNHDLVAGKRIMIKGRTGSTCTPAINDVFIPTSTGSKTFTIPVNCSVAGTGGYIISHVQNDYGANNAGAYRIERQSTTGVTGNMLLTCLKWGRASTMTATALSECTLLDNESNSRLRGMQIDGATTNYVLMWSTSQADPNVAAAVPTFPVVFTPSLTGSLKVRIHNLTPSTTYHYVAAVSPGTIEVRTASFGASVSAASSAAGVLEFTYTR